MNPSVMPLCRMLLAASACFLLASVATAQTVPSEDDLRALRYYTSQNQSDAASAEIRRLQAAFPGWTPSTEPEQLQSGPTTEVDMIYARIGSGDLAGARQSLTETRAKFPTWIPPADMLALLDVAESQAQFDAAISGGDAQAALRLATATPALLRCDRINNTWRVAELQAQSGNAAGALVAYQQILRACTKVPDIVATIEKANAVATDDDLKALIGLARERFPESVGALDTLEARMLAGRGVVAPPVKKADGVTAPAAEASADKPKAPKAKPEAKASAPEAAPSSRLSASDPLNLPRRGDGRIGKTRAAAQAGNFAECLARSVQPRSLEIVYERAWCSYGLDRSLEAIAQFSAVANGRLGAETTRDALYGMALSYLKQNMSNQAAQIAARTDLTMDQRKTVESLILDQRGLQAYQKKQYKDAVAFLQAKENMDGSLRRDLAIMMAYSFLNLGDRREAHRRFKLLNDALSTKDTQAGMRASQ